MKPRGEIFLLKKFKTLEQIYFIEQIMVDPSG